MRHYFTSRLDYIVEELKRLDGFNKKVFMFVVRLTCLCIGEQGLYIERTFQYCSYDYKHIIMEKNNDVVYTNTLRKFLGKYPL
jgi:hypothetical protein